MLGHPTEGIIRIPDVMAPRLLRDGSMVSLRVVGSLGKGYYRVLWDGRSMKAFARVPLRKGEVIRARLHRVNTRLELHIVRPGPSPSLSISPTPDTLSTAILRAGLALPDDNESRRRAALLARTSGPRAHMARLYAELLAKGLDPTADLLEFMEDFFSEKHDKGKRRPGKSVNWNGNAANLKEQLTSDGPAGSENDIIDLINLKQGRNSRWYFRDSTIRVAGRERRTAWKIRRGIQPALALSVHDGDRSLEFLIEGMSPIRLEVFATDGHGISQKSWEKFRQKIGSLEDIQVGLEIRPISESDGFTP